MNNRIFTIFLILVVVPFSLVIKPASQPASSQIVKKTKLNMADFKKVEDLEKNLITTYKPSKANCGAAITASRQDRVANFQGELACMITGHKDVLMDYMPEKADYHPLTKELLKKYNIKIIDFKLMNIGVYNKILYTQKGSHNAFLLKKHLRQTLSDIQLNNLQKKWLSLKREKQKAQQDQKRYNDQYTQQNQEYNRLTKEYEEQSEKQNNIAQQMLLHLNDPKRASEFQHTHTYIGQSIQELMNKQKSILQHQRSLHGQLTGIQKIIDEFEAQENSLLNKFEKHVPNDYLIGKLLGYDQKDIEYYYETVKRRSQAQYPLEDDKERAAEWLEKNKLEPMNEAILEHNIKCAQELM